MSVRAPSFLLDYFSGSNGGWRLISDPPIWLQAERMGDAFTQLALGAIFRLSPGNPLIQISALLDERC